MTDENELKRNLNTALDDQRDALAASIDAAYKLGLKQGRDEQSQQDQELEVPDHLKLVIERRDGKVKLLTLEQFKMHSQEDS